jgi:hypothetical protein
MLLSALRRLLGLLALAVGVAAVGSLLLGALAGISLTRALALGFYAVGSFLLLVGFFVGNRGPVRVRSESPGGASFPLAQFGNRRLGWATRNEQHETIGYSAVFIVLGFVLVLIGLAFDRAERLW